MFTAQVINLLALYLGHNPTVTSYSKINPILYYILKCFVCEPHLTMPKGYSLLSTKGSPSSSSDTR